MRPGHYTELFFLDEATALAAGHRPCAECLRPRFEIFRSLWAQANPDLTIAPKPRASMIDGALHEERIAAAQQKTRYAERLGALPEGCIVTFADARQSYLVFRGFLLTWRPEGYLERTAVPPEQKVNVLTPRSIVKAMALALSVQMHASAYQLFGE